MASDDRIELRGLHLSGIVGVLPKEQAEAQPLEIDLDITLDMADAGGSDSLTDTADYGALCDVTEQVVTTTNFQLLETLAQRIAQELAAVDRRISAVTVSVRKLRPPVAQPLRTSGVRITRTRA
ncbi:MAG: dihydroneopterin aldolase [Acidimicrobiia bacterium]|nr:dihydroneopterin aldolase [Acidimicrobiia bacterium]